MSIYVFGRRLFFCFVCLSRLSAGGGCGFQFCSIIRLAGVDGGCSGIVGGDTAKL